MAATATVDLGPEAAPGQGDESYLGSAPGILSILQLRARRMRGRARTRGPGFHRLRATRGKWGGQLEGTRGDPRTRMAREPRSPGTGPLPCPLPALPALAQSLSSGLRSALASCSRWFPRKPPSRLGHSRKVFSLASYPAFLPCASVSVICKMESVWKEGAAFVGVEGAELGEGR